MVLTRAVSAMALIALATSASHGQGGVRGMGGFATAASGPRPMLFGFALECSRCGAVGRGRMGGGGGFGGGGFGGRGTLALWHYEENPRIAVVIAGSAAQRAGIREGDYLLAVDGLSITTDEGAQRFADLRAGDTTHLTLERANKSITVDLVLNRGGGRGGALVEPPPANAPAFSTRFSNTQIDVWSDARVVSSTDSTGATILRIGNTVLRLKSDSQASGRGGRGRRGAPPSN